MDGLIYGVIHHMRVSIWPIWRARGRVYLAGSWREASSYFIAILTSIRENETITLTESLFH